MYNMPYNIAILETLLCILYNCEDISRDKACLYECVYWMKEKTKGGHIMKENGGAGKAGRILEIYDRLLSGEVLNKADLTEEYNLSITRSGIMWNPAW